MIEKYPDKEIVQKTVITGKYVNKPNMWNFDTFMIQKKRPITEKILFCKFGEIWVVNAMPM